MVGDLARGLSIHAQFGGDGVISRLLCAIFLMCVIFLFTDSGLIYLFDLTQAVFGAMIW